MTHWSERYRNRHLGHCPDCVSEGLPIEDYETWGWELVCDRHRVFWQPFDPDDGFEDLTKAEAIVAMHEAREACEAQGYRLIEPVFPNPAGAEVAA